MVTEHSSGIILKQKIACLQSRDILPKWKTLSTMVYTKDSYKFEIISSNANDEYVRWYHHYLEDPVLRAKGRLCL